MKKIIIISTVLLYSFASAQVSIGKTETDGNSTLLDFDEKTNLKGIILPAVSTVPIGLDSDINGGTFIFDKSSGSQAILMYENGAWVDLTGEGDASKLIPFDGTEKGNGVIIGKETTRAKGVLVLEAEDKAMILPKIASPEKVVNSPYPGMMCYDTITKSLAVFNGKAWSYWR